ncbi:YcgJ family protein [Serratia quinivorans]|uniref:YcgJ family protein n=1 Tax=Serratia quinivorans TaxID=137545 RepID=UPI0039AF8049
MLSAGAWAGPTAVFFPPAAQGVVCDRAAGFCADREGVSMGLTRQYLGEREARRLQQALGNVPPTYLDRFSLSNGVYCNRAAQACYTGRRTSVPDRVMTQALFGPESVPATSGEGHGRSDRAAVFFPPDVRGGVCDRRGGFCADRNGLSMGLTALYLGGPAEDRLMAVVGQMSTAELGRYTLSNGVYCESARKTCYVSKFSRQRDVVTTRWLFEQSQ